MSSDIYILSHQDDEIAILKSIKNTIVSKRNIFIYFLTNGNINDYENIELINKREKESKKVLNELGVNSENIEFLGRKLKTKSYTLLNKLNETYEILFHKINKLQDDVTIYTHAWEGGNIDHDSTFIVSLKLYREISKIKLAYQFPFYNSYKMPLHFFRVFCPIYENGIAEKLHLTFSEKLRFIKKLFNYSSQLKIWIGLYPFIIFKILINEYNYLQKIEKKFFLRKPHKNLLWYEKQNFANFEETVIKFKSFLSNN